VGSVGCSVGCSLCSRSRLTWLGLELGLGFGFGSGLGLGVGLVSGLVTLGLVVLEQQAHRQVVIHVCTLRAALSVHLVRT
jgi:hypothetical protein